MNVRVKKVDGAKLPIYQTLGSAGCDVTSVENVVIPAGRTKLVKTGIFLEVPEGFECQVRPRSGLALKNGITVFNSPGTIDSDYRGEVMILLYNVGSAGDYFVKKGERIAQLVFAPVVQATFEEVDELNVTSRNAGGWGSTGH